MAQDWPAERRCKWRIYAVQPIGWLRLRQAVTLRCISCWDSLEFEVYRPWWWEHQPWSAADGRQDAEARALAEMPAWAQDRLCHRHLRSLPPCKVRVRA